MNKECAEFRRRLDSPSAGPDGPVWHHLEVCPRCAAFLDQQLRGTPDGLDKPVWEPLPSSLTYNTFKNILARGDSDFWQYVLAGLSGLALAAAVFLIVIRTAPMPDLTPREPVVEQYSFLETGPDPLSQFSFIENSLELAWDVTGDSDSGSNDWTFIEPSPNLSFLENDKEALWEDQSNG